MSTIRELDTVALRSTHGRWAAGTTGAVLEIFQARTALVELVGPDGQTVDLLTVALEDLELAPAVDSAHRTGRLAG